MQMLQEGKNPLLGDTPANNPAYQGIEPAFQGIKTTKPSETMKLCPWCNSHPYTAEDAHGCLIGCSNMACSVKPMTVKHTKDLAIKAWESTKTQTPEPLAHKPQGT